MSYGSVEEGFECRNIEIRSYVWFSGGSDPKSTPHPSPRSVFPMYCAVQTVKLVHMYKVQMYWFTFNGTAARWKAETTVVIKQISDKIPNPAETGGIVFCYLEMW